MYHLEDLRTFFTRRNWLVGDDGLITPDEYDLLKARALDIGGERLIHLRGFVAGWLAAKGGN